MKEIIATLATEQGIGPQAIRKWRERGKVSHTKRLTLLLEAQKRGLPLKPGDFEFPKSTGRKRSSPKRVKAA